MNKMPILYRIGRFILGPFFKWYYNPTIIGKENIPKEGAILIVGNHKHLYDQCLSIISTKRFIKYMAKREYFDNKKTRWFFKAVGCISVDRSVHDGKAKGEAIETLKTQEFLLPFKFGAVSMAKKTDAYLVPFGITGDYIFRSKNLVIKYGKPFKVTDMELEEANNLLYETVKKLMEDTLEK